MTTSERPTLPRRSVLAMAISAGLAGRGRASLPSSLADLAVVDRETGQLAQVWRHAGRLFIAGRPGGRYSLRVTNNSGERVLVVMSVDGVNVLTGETAGYAQSGYVFWPYETYDVSGWRKSDTEVAAFTFAPLSRSYAARTGRAGDVGVIGIAVFRERAPVAFAQPWAGRRSGPANELEELVVPPAPAARAAPADEVVTAQRREEKLGTGHGAREYSAVTSVPFERATASPQLIRRIEYDSYANLVAYGVIRPSQAPPRRPQPFPSSPDGGGYVPDPPGGG